MFHLCKQTRIYQGYPYCGPSSNDIPQEYETGHSQGLGKCAAELMLWDCADWRDGTH